MKFDNHTSIQNYTSSDDETIVLINPIILNLFNKTNYDISQSNKQKDNIYNLDINIKTNSKLDKKSKKIDRNQDEVDELAKSKTKSKKKVQVEFETDDEYLNVFNKPKHFDNVEKNIRKTEILNEIKTINSTIGKKNKKLLSRKKEEIVEDNEIPKELRINSSLTVQEFAELTSISDIEIIRTLFLKGQAVTVNQILDIHTIIELGKGFNINIQLEEKNVLNEVKIEKNNSIQFSENTIRRAPIVTILGHVDHGKTTLLDKIRQTQIAQKEAGGITQKIAAYKVNVHYKNENRNIVFLDTPGHEAFSNMRSRGINVTDIVILLVAADDGVKPQTIEAINAIKAAKLPIIVAINKIDKDQANIEKVQQELSKYELIPESWGGQTPMIPISASQGTNIDSLLELILLMADIENYQAIEEDLANGTILEAHIDRTRGPIASILVQNGTLKLGDIIVTGTSLGKIRGMLDTEGNKINTLGPSSPGIIWGLNKSLNSGDKFQTFSNEKEAKTYFSKESENNKKITYNYISENPSNQILEESSKKILNFILKTDTQGSIEAIVNAISRIKTKQLQIKILYSNLGEVTETDIEFASTTNAFVLAFNTRLAPGAKKTARQLNIDIREYNVVYDLVEDIESIIAQNSEPEYKKLKIGVATVKAVFPLGKNFVAGIIINEGKILRSSHIQVQRKSGMVFEGGITTVKIVKKDVEEVSEGNECGLFINEFSEWKVGDNIEIFELIQI